MCSVRLAGVAETSTASEAADVLDGLLSTVGPLCDSPKTTAKITLGKLFLRSAADRRETIPESCPKCRSGYYTDSTTACSHCFSCIEAATLSQATTQPIRMRHGIDAFQQNRCLRNFSHTPTFLPYATLVAGEPYIVLTHIYWWVHCLVRTHTD